ncbi:MAG: LCCL domain-containing protein [Phycisphaeraceae bacterium]
MTELSSLSRRLWINCTLAAILLLTGPRPVHAEEAVGAKVAPPALAKAGASAAAEDVAEAQLVDGSTLHLALLDESIELVTRYGKLHIPVADIQKLQFAARLSPEEAKAIPKLVAQLGSEDFELRESATAALAAMGPRAYPSLRAAAAGEEAEAVRRAKGLIEKLHESVGEEKLASIANDVIHTRESKIAGRLTTSALKVGTRQFGELTLKLADVRELNRGQPASDLPADAPVAPANMTGHQDKAGQTVIYKVTGGQPGSGSVWGTDVYTLDTSVALAAVHAGIVKPGETKVVRIMILGQTDGFVGTTRNGITSSTYGAYPGAFKLVK